MILTHTISLPELVWTCVSAFGLYFALRLYLRAVNDMRWLVRLGMNSDREQAARILIVTYGLIAFSQLSSTVIGLIAMALPTANVGEVNPFTYVIAAVFILKSLTLAGGEFLVDRMRQALVKKLATGITEKQKQQWEDEEEAGEHV